MEEYKRCDQCGTVNTASAETKPCKQCGAPVAGVAQATPAPDVSPAIDSPDAPETTEGEVEAIGAYGKAADAAWVDPAEQVRQEEEAVELDVPEEILERAKAARARRNNLIGLAAAAAGALFLAVLLAAC